MTNKIKLTCKYDSTEVVFRSPKKDKRGQLRLSCPVCSRNYKAADKPESHLYEVRPRKDPDDVKVLVTGRFPKRKLDAVLRKHATWQNYLDSLDVVG